LDSVIERVLNHEFDVGVIELDLVSAAIQRGADLKILHRLPNPGFLWVAGPQLNSMSTNYSQTLQRSLLSLKDPAILQGLHPLRITSGFESARPPDYDYLEAVLQKARRFDRSE
jgi:hypothetical protein